MNYSTSPVLNITYGTDATEEKIHSQIMNLIIVLYEYINITFSDISIDLNNTVHCLRDFQIKKASHSAPCSGIKMSQETQAPKTRQTNYREGRRWATSCRRVETRFSETAGESWQKERGRKETLGDTKG